MKQLYRIWCLTLSLGLFLISCQKETIEDAFLNIDEKDMVSLEQPFIHEANSRMIPLNTNLDVIKVSSSADWCKVSIVDNKGVFLRVEVYPNEGFEERTADITVFGQNVEAIKIPVTQWSSEPLLVVAESEGINIVDGELDFTMHITSNVDFKLEVPVWVTNVGDNTPFVGSKLYTFVASSIAPGDRVGYIKVITDGHPELDQIIEISQHQNILQPELTDFAPLAGEKESTVVLNGVNFGTNKDLVKVFFNSTEAEVVNVADNAITVNVPRAPGSSCAIKISILDNNLTYTVPFTYQKSWGLYTVTGHTSTATFKGGTLAEGRLKARYISVDDNGNVFATHRDEGNNKYIVRINESQNIVQALGSSFGTSGTPNGSCVGRNNIVYVANDMTAGTTYFEMDPANSWTPVSRTISYPEGVPPATGGAYMYRLVYVSGATAADDRLYGVIGQASGPVIEINPNTRVGKVLYNGFSANPTSYALTVNPADKSKLYTMVNAQVIGYGPYFMNLANPAAGFTKLNSATTVPGNSPVSGLTNNLETSGFGVGWDLEFGPDGYLYVSDNTNHIIRKINLTAKTIETIIGTPGVAGAVDGKGNQARLNNPRGLAWNKEGTTMYISDFGNNMIRKWTFD